MSCCLSNNTTTQCSSGSSDSNSVLCLVVFLTTQLPNVVVVVVIVAVCYVLLSFCLSVVCVIIFKRTYNFTPPLNVLLVVHLFSYTCKPAEG